LTKVEREAISNMKIDLGNLLTDLTELRGVQAFDEARSLADKLRNKIDEAVEKTK